MSRGNTGEGADKLLILPESKEITARARTIDKVNGNHGSWEERRQVYQYFNGNIATAPEFEVQDTREAIPDFKLINFPDNDMTEEDVRKWLKEHPEYDDYELARPEHLDDLNAHPDFTRMAKEEVMWVVALGASATVEGERSVADLDAWGDGGRELDLDPAGGRWDREAWFLLVRKAGT